jgi:hypothetical protein
MVKNKSGQSGGMETKKTDPPDITAKTTLSTHLKNKPAHYQEEEK